MIGKTIVVVAVDPNNSQTQNRNHRWHCNAYPVTTLAVATMTIDILVETATTTSRRTRRPKTMVCFHKIPGCRLFSSESTINTGHKNCNWQACKASSPTASWGQAEGLCETMPQGLGLGFRETEECGGSLSLGGA